MVVDVVCFLSSSVSSLDGDEIRFEINHMYAVAGRFSFARESHRDRRRRSRRLRHHYRRRLFVSLSNL